MARTLRNLGMAILVIAVWLLIAESAGWISPDLAGPWIIPALYTGGGALVAGIVLGVVSPVGRMMRQTRCARCGNAVERGQTYCLEHLRQTVDEYRDRQRGGIG